MFTNQERAELSRLSKELYGSESRWRKEYDRGAFNMPTDSTEVVEKVDTVQFRNKDGRLGQIMTRDKALARGLVKEDQVPAERSRSVQNYRKPTYDEILKAFDQMLDISKLSRLKAEDACQVFAYRYVKDTLPFVLSLVVREGSEKDVEDLLAISPESKRQALSDIIVKNGESPKGLPVDAFQFLSDVVFAANHPGSAKEMADDALNSVSVKRTNSYGTLAPTLGKPVTDGFDKKARKSKNKASRKARRQNRGK